MGCLLQFHANQTYVATQNCLSTSCNAGWAGGLGSGLGRPGQSHCPPGPHLPPGLPCSSLSQPSSHLLPWLAQTCTNSLYPLADLEQLCSGPACSYVLHMLNGTFVTLQSWLKGLVLTQRGVWILLFRNVYAQPD